MTPIHQRTYNRVGGKALAIQAEHHNGVQKGMIAKKQFVCRGLCAAQGDGAFIPLRLTCSREAKVSDLIGLTCYLYTLEARQPRLEPPVENYR